MPSDTLNAAVPSAICEAISLTEQLRDLRTDLDKARRQREEAHRRAAKAEADYRRLCDDFDQIDRERSRAWQLAHAAAAESKAWAEAIRSVAFGAVISPQAAHAAIKELFEKWRSTIAIHEQITAAHYELQSTHCALQARVKALECAALEAEPGTRTALRAELVTPLCERLKLTEAVVKAARAYREAESATADPTVHDRVLCRKNLDEALAACPETPLAQRPL